MNTKLMFSSDSNEWETPQELFNGLDREFHFTIDAAATRENTKCNRFFSIKQDGLFQTWDKERVFLNPPYGRQIGKWVKKAYEENLLNQTLIVMLIPARTDTRYFHGFIYNKA